MIQADEVRNAQLPDSAVPENASTFSGDLGTGAETIVIPVLEESVHVQKEKRETGRVRIHKGVVERTVAVNEQLEQESVVVERVAINRFVDGPQPTRQEGNVTIIPVLEEVLVVEKRLMLKEEVRIHRLQKTIDTTQDVTVRIEEAQVERMDGEREK